MGWRTIVVNTHSKLSYKNNHLIFKSSTQTEVVHLSEIDILLIETTDVALTTMLIKRLVDENILVVFCDNKRLPIAQLVPYYAKHDTSLQVSKQIQWNYEICANVWTIIIAQKIQNQANFLRVNGFFEKSESIRELYYGLQILDPTNREGHAARIYFNTLFGNDFSRENSSIINAGLDYGYTLLLSLFAREIVLTGCITQIGLKHNNQFNQFNLASDIMEPFRVVVDSIVYENRHMPFDKLKSQLFTMFTRTYEYQGKNMYLTNVVSDYTKKIIKNLNGELVEVPEFNL